PVIRILCFRCVHCLSLCVCLCVSCFLDVLFLFFVFFFQAEDGIRDRNVTGVQTCALPIWRCPRIAVCIRAESGLPGAHRMIATVSPRCSSAWRSEVCGPERRGLVQYAISSVSSASGTARIS